MVDEKDISIGLIGGGTLHRAVQQIVMQSYKLLALTLDNFALQARPCSLVIYCDDSYRPQQHREINRKSLEHGVPLLPVYTEFGRGIIGPCVIPGKHGCITCAEMRRLMVREDASGYVKMHESFRASGYTPHQPWLHAMSQETIARLVVQDVNTWIYDPDRLQTRRALLHVELDTLQNSRHHFLPEPECPDCGDLPPDTAESAIIHLQSRPKPEPGTYRIRSLSADLQQLYDEYVDAETGLFHSLAKNESSPIVSVVTYFGVDRGNGPVPLLATGHGLSCRQSQAIAIAEALERYGGQRPKGKRTTVRASYHQLGDRALDPTTLGLHSAAQPTSPDDRFVPYHHDLAFHWVWGYSFQHQGPILVPERYVYYGIPFQNSSENPPFVYEVSNGCALGSCLEEAIFHGILEVVERDAFLITWYAQLRVPRIDPHSASDPSIRLLVEYLEDTSGYTILVFNTTLDHAIPCLWVMAIDEQSRPDMPKVWCGAASHPHPEQAMARALQELSFTLTREPGWFEDMRAHMLEMLENPFAVKELEDHPLLYCLPEAFERFNFLLRSQQQQTFQEAFRDFYQHSLAHRDLRDDLNTLINYYLAQDIDTIVVDQSSAEHAAQGFHCVKVIMPGMLPMTFGHMHRRVRGFKRLYHLPHALGYYPRALTEEDINPHPHPFP